MRTIFCVWILILEASALAQVSPRSLTVPTRPAYRQVPEYNPFALFPFLAGIPGEAPFMGTMPSTTFRPPVVTSNSFANPPTIPAGSARQQKDPSTAPVPSITGGDTFPSPARPTVSSNSAKPKGRESSPDRAQIRQAGKSLCIGEPGAPLRMIYLHGLRPNSDEPSNVKRLQEIAKQRGIQIALPISKDAYQWNYTKAAPTLDYVERESQRACGARLPHDGVTLFGFSNGSYMARNTAKLSCDRISRYNNILVVGMPRKHMSYPRSECSNKVVFIEPHSTPSLDRMVQVTEYMENLNGPPSVLASQNAGTVRR